MTNVFSIIGRHKTDEKIQAGKGQLKGENPNDANTENPPEEQNCGRKQKETETGERMRRKKVL